MNISIPTTLHDDLNYIASVKQTSLEELCLQVLSKEITHLKHRALALKPIAERTPLFLNGVPELNLPGPITGAEILNRLEAVCPNP